MTVLEAAFAEAPSPWQPYQGPHGGRGWQNAQTGEVLYQEERPDQGAAQPPSAPSGQPSETHQKLLASMQDFSPEELAQVAKLIGQIQKKKQRASAPAKGPVAASRSGKTAEDYAAGLEGASRSMTIDVADKIIARAREAIKDLSGPEFGKFANAVLGGNVFLHGTKANVLKQFSQQVNMLAVTHGQTQFSHNLAPKEEEWLRRGCYSELLELALAETDDMETALLAADMAFADAEFGMVKGEWHGPTPPSPEWRLIRTGPRGGKVWGPPAGTTPRQQAPRGSAAVSASTVVQKIQTHIQKGFTEDGLKEVAGDLMKMRVVDIMSVKKQLGLKASGRKQELVDKLVQRAKEASERSKPTVVPKPPEEREENYNKQKSAPPKSAPPKSAPPKSAPPKLHAAEQSILKGMRELEPNALPPEKEPAAAPAQMETPPPKLNASDALRPSDLSREDLASIIKQLGAEEAPYEVPLPDYVGEPIDLDDPAGYLLRRLEESAQPIIDKLSPEELSMIKNYTGSYFYDLNEQTRKCPEKLDCLSWEQKKFYDAVEKAARSALLPPDTFLFRGLGVSGNDKKTLLESAQAARSLKSSYRMPSITSASVSAGVAADFTANDSVFFHIKAKRGLYVDKISVAQGEKEVIQSHKTKYRVIDIRDNVEMSYRGAPNPEKTVSVIYLEEI